MERLDKILANTGRWSRKEARELIRAGRVSVDGVTARAPEDKADPAAVFTVDGERISGEKQVYLMLHKPRGFVTTTSDERGRKTVMDLLADYPVRVFPVGRLDKDSEGLLLLTNDGGFANLMMHPSHGVSKLYRVTVHPRAEESQVVALSKGVTLDDGTTTQPAVVNVVVDEPGRTVLEMTIKEGKNRQIRRMCEAVGLEVVRLRRSAMGAVKLGMLQPGQYRELTKSEVAALRAAAQKGKAKARTQASQEAAARRAARTEKPRRASAGRRRPAKSE